MPLDVIVVGGGAAGLMASGVAAELGKKVLLVEKNQRLARKVLITGKGRCNVTNNCDRDTFLRNVPGNSRFLYSAISQFSAQDTMDFFEQRGVPLKTERGSRVFPQSDKAYDIAAALSSFAKSCGVQIRHAAATGLLIEGKKVVGIELDHGEKITAASVIVATGGLSYPLTGSTGDGYRFAQQAGHTIVPLTPSLVPLVVKEQWCSKLQGLSLKNVLLTVTDRQDGKRIFQEQGEMLFTHYGISGPLVLSVSSHLREMKPERYQIAIDLKPALTPEQLDTRILRDFELFKNKDFSNALDKLLPRKMIPVVISLSGIPESTKVNQISREQRQKLGRIIKCLELTVLRFRPVEEAIITSGGVSTKEINPKTMESKLVEGLFFAGEVIDVDAYTGGFNLQIAFSTGYLAGMYS